jgi:hypothetical protein
MLQPEQKAALEKAGVDLVAMLLADMRGGGPDAPVSGLQCAPPRKSDVENWLANRVKEDRSRQKWTLWWAVIAGVGAVGAVVLGLVALWK